MVDCTGLLSRRAFTGTEGSNPSLSAIPLPGRWSAPGVFICQVMFFGGVFIDSHHPIHGIPNIEPGSCLDPRCDGC